MIFGIGVDIAEIKRFKKWVSDDSILKRFFNEKEVVGFNNASGGVNIAVSGGASVCITDRRMSAMCQHYAVRFAAKEAFSKALGTGVRGFLLKDIYVLNDELGKPYIVLENSALEVFNKRCPNGKIHLSLSHEKEYAIAYVIIEI